MENPSVFAGIVWKEKRETLEEHICVHEWTAKTGRADGVGSI